MRRSAAMQQNEAGVEKKHYLVLDGLRGIAAIAVVISHRRWFAPGGHAFDHGLLAVNFFFMLSGFVIDHAYTARLAKGMTLTNFAMRRVIRLYPLIIAGALLGLSYTLSLAYVHKNPSLYQNYFIAATFNLFCLPAPMGFVESPFFINRPTWSLFFELIANAGFGIFLFRFSNKALWITLFFTLPMVIYVAFQAGTINIGFNYGDLLSGIPAVFAPFIIGILINRIKHLIKLPELPFWLSGLILIFLFQPYIYSDAREPIYQIVLMLIVFPLLIMASTRSEPTGLWRSTARFGGFISYPVYVLHYPILQFISGAGEILKIPHPVTLCIIVIASIVVAWVAGKYYDEPVRRWLESKLLRKKAH